MKGKKIMNLPKIETATYELTVPSSNEIIKYRPFLVKEEKILSRISGKSIMKSSKSSSTDNI